MEVGVLFGFGGTPKTHGQLAKEEFGVGFDHMMQAATYAAGGVGSAMGPRVHNVRSRITPAAGRVRSAASSSWDSLAPIMVAAREGAREATEAALKAKAKESKRHHKEEQVKPRRMGLALGLLAAGVAAGAAAALVVRRRRRSAWEDYDASGALESMMDSVSQKPSDMTAGDMKARASDVSQKAGDAAQEAAGKTGETVQKAADKTSNAAQKAGEKAQEMGQKASDRFADTGERTR